MPKRGQTVKILALLESALLLAMMLLAADALPPETKISDLPYVEAGIEVVVLGLLADHWYYETGSEALILVDDSSSQPLKVVCSKAIRAMPSEYASIGDELRVKGEIRGSSPGHYLVTTSDSVVLVREAEFALTVEMLFEHWTVFLEEAVDVRGAICSDWVSGHWRLASSDGSRSVELLFESAAPLVECNNAVVHGVLRFDGQSMSLVFVASAVRAATQ